ncbi:MAG TPA: hypothetical protein VNJ54_13030 [Plantibacter sp.]|uniref:hypothetical protein n=1 Tax=unclassified Plantibacter TaxID=2624265 RepID=UPI002BD0D10C|nr:hypothetical protein [Plantibacter sp.]
MSEHDDPTAATGRLQEPAGQTKTPSTTSGGRAARFGTILWGVILLVFAGAMLTTTLTQVRIDPLAWVTGGLIATGAVLVVAGVAAAVRRRP